VSDLSDVVREFLVESYENLDQLERDFVTLEQDPTSRLTLCSVFRTIHTIKGTCSFLGFEKLESVAHVGESVLSKLRDGELRLRPNVTTALLTLVDAIREILGNIEFANSEGDADYTELLQSLLQLPIDGGSGSPAAAVRSPPESARPPDGDASCTTALPTGVVANAIPRAESEHIRRSVADSGSARRVERRESSVSDSTIRVEVGLLDNLMNRVGELVLTRNQILQFTQKLDDSEFLSTSQKLNLITSELQEGVMKTRMQPIGSIWDNFPRIVRDLAVQCGKQVRIDMDGKETELDKSIVEAIKDPLTHLIRNAVGCLKLRAFHEGGQVIIEIIDDGAGLNFDRIRLKAVERGLIGADQAPFISDHDAAQLIYAPGFSTTTTVTNVSGRGVGMDVVKTNIEKIGGTVDIRSRTGMGTTVKLRIPLTLAIVPALIVTCGGDRYAIPHVSLLELVRLEGERKRKGIERLHGALVYRLRGRLLPIVYLRRELGLPSTEISAAPAQIDRDVLNIVVLRADDRQFGLVVDSINDTEEIVVKPLTKHLKNIPVYAGATIMSDGKVALILDVLGTAQRAGVVSAVRDRSLTENATRSGDNTTERQAILILEVGDRRLALPIAMVSRLEEIPRTAVEKSDHQEVVQYRGQILPLLRLGKLLGIDTNGNPDLPLQVVVFSQRDRSVGLIVDRIADIVDEKIEVTKRGQSDELVATAVIQQRVTDLLNLPQLIRRANPTFFEAPTAQGALA
jgi:two-component system chemotaxis sensor kinase CheA